MSSHDGSKGESGYEQTVEATESVKNDTVDRKAELAELLKSTAEKMSPEGKTKQEEKPKEKAPKKTSVKSKLQEGKEKVSKTPVKKSKTQEERA